MKALVTGASGFIGRRLASTLARRGHDVACLVRKTSKTGCLGRDHFWIYDGSKIARKLGFRPRSTMRDSVRRAVTEAGPQTGPKRARHGARA